LLNYNHNGKHFELAGKKKDNFIYSYISYIK